MQRILMPRVWPLSEENQKRLAGLFLRKESGEIRLL